MMPRILNIILYGATFCLGFSTLVSAMPWPRYADYHIALDSRFSADQWPNGYGHIIQRTDLRHRLQLKVFRIGARDGITFNFDADVGADLGPEPRDFQHGIDDRRTALNLYAAELQLSQVIPKTTVRMGRHIFVDAIGLDGVDGMSIRNGHLPGMDVVVRGGLATRRSWWSIGPHLGYLDGAPQRENIGYTVGVALESRYWTWLSAQTAWRRIFDPDILRDEVGTHVRWGITPTASLSVQTIADLLVLDLAELNLTADYAISPTVAVTNGIGFNAPRFAADTIWTAFDSEPYGFASIAVKHVSSGLSTRLAFIERVFDIAPNDGRHVLVAPQFKTDALAHEGQLNMDYRTFVGVHPKSIGLSGRFMNGYGGQRSSLSVHGSHPLFWPKPQRPIYIRGQLGGFWFNDKDRHRWDGLSGWAQSGLEWPMDEGLATELTVEGFFGNWAQSRVRTFLAVKVDNWW
ncbi:MAG: hypothetical protein VX589_20055 [Myxococcota bacterium]|nr:hypothetical protein [Myxococcota bacterium]